VFGSCQHSFLVRILRIVNSSLYAALNTAIFFCRLLASSKISFIKIALRSGDRVRVESKKLYGKRLTGLQDELAPLYKEFDKYTG